MNRTFIAFAVTLGVLFAAAGIYDIASAIGGPPIPRDTESQAVAQNPSKGQPDNAPCSMAAADIRMFADDYQAGVPLSTELDRYGNHDFRRSIIQQTYQISARSGGSPADIQQAAYEQCSARASD